MTTERILNGGNYMSVKCFDKKDDKLARPVIGDAATFPAAGDEFVGTKRVSTVLYGVEYQKARIMASFVPDEIIYSIEDYSIRQYDVVLVLGDVSGFTDLSEKYNKTGKGGPSRLTQILNNYIGSMVQEIMRHNGDLLKFSGDAYLAMWKCVGDRSMRDVMSQVLACALIIQRSYGRYETDVGVTLKVKLGIAAGPGYFSIIGDEKMRHYVILGESVLDVKLAEHSCSAGEVMLAPSAWQYVNAMEFQHEYHTDGKHVKITGCGETWQEDFKIDEDIVEGPTEEDTHSDTQDDVIIMYSDRTPKPEAGPILMSLSGSSVIKGKKPKEFSLRPSVDDASKKKMKGVLQPFIIPVVMRGVELGEPMEYLTEMRQVVIVFLNIIPYEKDWLSLIRLVDSSYQIVCKLVDKAHGCVNKVSYFDKDLMMLIIFGLRGYKHEFESQSALMCALDVRIACESLDGVRTASIGVTTGMSYCGVVGHVLRREYTVIGVPVNKGARLMVAYPGKVTCDREVFLHSKLDSLHFVLQEPKPLKGLQNVGPIYEYREKPVAQGVSSVSKYPLLGREMELELFSQMLENLSLRKINPNNKEVDMKNTLLMKGEPRLGKTRLLDEMIYIAQGKAMVHKISLNPRDQKVPFKTLQLIFAPTLGLPETSSPKEKEDKLIMVLKHAKFSKWLSCLNPVFSVNFTLSKEYLNSNDAGKKQGLKIIMDALFRACFSQIWVLGIDDSEYMDEDSWMLLSYLIDPDCALLAMTCGTRRELPPCVSDIIENEHVQYIELVGIDKWYHAGLVCQIIDVRAIPAELEKTIQCKSKGNPGWIESYLMSLIQAGGIMTHTITMEEMVHLGLVSPPDEMMFRLPESIIQTRIEEKRVKLLGDEWKMYESSYKESIGHLTALDVLEGKKRSIVITVCRMAPGFQLEDVDSGVTIDAMVLQVYDALTTFEQLLLKCSCVMGKVFPRSMLLYIMNRPPSDLEEIACAVQKLFEIRVISCARGDFTEGDNFLVGEQHVGQDSNEIVCECINLVIPECCADLPKYASCGLMKFRMSLFRDTTYSLLLDNQKKEYHLRAARFIEKETRRCKSCGGGIFTRILWGFNKESRRYKIRDKRVAVIERKSDEMDEDAGEGYSSEDLAVEKMRKSTQGTPLVMVESRLTIGELEADYISVSSTIVRCRLIPMPCYKAEGSSVSLTETFSSLDFSNCQCPAILNTMYTFLLDHYRGAGKYDKVMDIVLEFTELTIGSSNHPQSMMLLEEADSIIEAGKLPADILSSWRVPYITGRIHTLRGYSSLESGRLQDAARELYAAMLSYGYKFPHYNIPAQFKIKYQRMKLKFVLDIMPNWAIGRARGYYGQIADQISECLALMYTLFKVTQYWKLAELAAIWGLNKALQSDSDFYGVCTSYSNLMETAQHYGNVYFSWKLEGHAINACLHKTFRSIDAEELRAIARLYFAIFCCRVMRAEIIRGISVGFKTLKICGRIHAIRLKLQMIPLVITMLLLRQRVSECITLMTELDFIATEDTDKSARTWYYALCVAIQLETGYSYVSFKNCEQYFQEEGESMITLRDPDAEKRYFICMWLWCMRNQQWEAATVWEPQIHLPSIMLEEENVTNVMTALYLLEGILLFMVGKLDLRDFKEVNRTYMDVTALIKHIQKASKVIKIILPRFQILKALYRHIRYRDPNAMRHLYLAKALAQKQGNLLDLQWSEHTEKVWTGTIPAVIKDFWTDHCQPDNLLDWHEGAAGNMVMFSFPVPKYGV